jgi:hypothetical protein
MSISRKTPPFYTGGRLQKQSIQITKYNWGAHLWTNPFNTDTLHTCSIPNPKIKALTIRGQRQRRAEIQHRMAGRWWWTHCDVRQWVALNYPSIPTCLSARVPCTPVPIFPWFFRNVGV